MIRIENFLAYTIGIIVFFCGMQLNRKVAFLRTYNIPEPVTGGILAALVTLTIYQTSGLEIEFDLQTRDRLLIYFFTSIGLNAKLTDLIRGGRPLFILLALTLGYMVLQNVVGVVSAKLLGLPSSMGLLTGSAALMGGHGTVIAWAPEIEANHGVKGALEIGVAAATLGLVLASLLGGPVAKFLLSRNKIECPKEDKLLVGISHDKENTEQINHVSFMSVLLVLHVSIIFGWILNEGLTNLGFKLPLFVPCLLSAIALSNTVPRIFPKMRWPAGTRALAVVSGFSLEIFIAMSLMGMQLWTLGKLAGPLLVLLGAQVLAVLLFIFFVFFRLMGKDYMATVLSSGFIGFSMGATPTAVANMTAVAKSHGPAPQAFIILPLVGAFFVDLANSFVIQWFLKMG